MTEDLEFIPPGSTGRITRLPGISLIRAVIFMTAVLLFPGTPTQLTAQDTGGRSGWAGLRYGRAASEISDAAIGDAMFEALRIDMERRGGTLFGAYIGIPIGSFFALQAEANFIPRGADFLLTGPVSFPGDNLEELPPSARVGLAVSYLELPLLARIDFFRSGKAHPYIITGPSASLRAACTWLLDLGRTKLDFNCDGSDLGATGIGAQEDYLRKFDMGLIGGVGFAFRFFGLPLAVEGRVSRGLLSVMKENPEIDARNQTISVFLNLGR